MIAWLMTNWMTQLATIAFATWFARGVWKATMRPRLTYVSHSKVEGHGWFLTVRRQHLLPPFMCVEETWHLHDLSGYGTTARVSDGHELTDRTDLRHSLANLVLAARARDAETDELLKQEARPN